MDFLLICIRLHTTELSYTFEWTKTPINAVTAHKGLRLNHYATAIALHFCPHCMIMVLPTKFIMMASTLLHHCNMKAAGDW